MKIVERYLAASLGRHALLAFLVLGSLVTMMVFSLTALRESTSFLTVPSLLRVVLLSAATQLQVLVPLTVLIASIWTYGGAQADGEIAAMRGAGVSLWRCLQPALLLGALGTLLLALFQDAAIPTAHYEQRRVGRRFLADGVDRLLQDSRTTIRDRRFSCRWERIGNDEEGNPVLENFVVAEVENDPPRFTRAGRATPWVDLRERMLVLELEELGYHDSGAAETMRIALDLRAVADEPPPSRRVRHLDYAELLSLTRLTPDPELAREADTEFHVRAARSSSAILFSLLGATLGVMLGLRNRAAIFAIGFGLVLTLHYAPSLVGESLARTGALNPVVATWSGNLLVVAATLQVFRRGRRR